MKWKIKERKNVLILNAIELANDSCTKGGSIGPECEDFNCNNCVNFKEVEKGKNMNINEKFKIIKALNFITNLRDENYVKLDSMKKSIQDKNNKTIYNTGV